jgi:hypothetical protein
MNLSLDRYYEGTRLPGLFANNYWHLHDPRTVGDSFGKESWFENPVYGGADLPVVDRFIGSGWTPWRDTLLSGQLPAEPFVRDVWGEMPWTSWWGNPALGGYALRGLEAVRWLVIHHDLTGWVTHPLTATQEIQYCKDLAAYFINSLKYPGIAYHYVIFPSGRVYLVCPLDRTAWHCGVYDSATGAIIGLDENRVSIGIVFAENVKGEEPTSEALAAGKRLVNDLQRGLPLFQGNSPQGKVLAHGALPGAQTDCPGAARRAWVEREFGTGGTVPIPPALPGELEALKLEYAALQARVANAKVLIDRAKVSLGV